MGHPVESWGPSDAVNQRRARHKQAEDHLRGTFSEAVRLRLDTRTRTREWAVAERRRAAPRGTRIGPVAIAPSAVAAPRRQIVDTKSPLAVIPSTSSGASPLLASVAVRAALVVPTGWPPNSRLAGPRRTAGPVRRRIQASLVVCDVRVRFLALDLHPVDESALALGHGEHGHRCPVVWTGACEVSDGADDGVLDGQQPRRRGRVAASPRG